MTQIMEQGVSAQASARQTLEFEAEQIARDLALMDEIEAYAQSLPSRRDVSKHGPLPDNAVADAYEAREAGLL